MAGIVAKWASVREIMLPSIERTHGTHDEDTVVAMLMVGKAKLWVFEHSACITEVIEYPLLKALNLWLIGGKLEEVLAHEPVMAAFGAGIGCRRLTAGGRDGWDAVKPSGWNKTAVLFYKEIV